MPDRPFLAVYPLGLLAALAVAVCVTPLVGRLALWRGIVSYPRRDRWHTSPTPLLGGVAIFAATVPLFLLIPQPYQPNPLDRFAGLLLGATLMFLVGLYDDHRGMPPYGKLLAQVVAACVLIIGGLPLNKIPFPIITVPLSIFWIVGVTNAFNLLDNMDGLSAGIAMVVAGTLAGHNHLQGDRQMALFCLMVAGACGGFLIFNFNPAKIFMGDSGSLLLGYVLSGTVVLGAAKATSEMILTVLVPVTIMALPILDTSLVTVMRALNRRPISQGGRDHLSHRLVALGLSERQAVLVLYGVSALTGVLVLGAGFIGAWPAVALGAVLGLVILFLGINLAQVRIYSEADYQRIESDPGLVGKLVLSGSVLYKRQIAEMMLDLSLICVALLSAYVIRFEGALEKHYVEQFVAVLPYVVVAKLSALFLFGTYRAVWRYFGPSDLGRTVVASLAGSVAAAVVLALVFRSEGVPRAILVLDFFLLTMLLGGSRLVYVHLPDLLDRLRRQDLIRVLIVGAGDTGELVLRAMRRSNGRAYRVVGFLDDDEAKFDRAIHGVRVLGPAERLEDIVLRESVDEVVVAARLSEREALAVRCRDLGVELLDAATFFQAHVEAQPVEVAQR